MPNRNRPSSDSFDEIVSGKRRSPQTPTRRSVHDRGEERTGYRGRRYQEPNRFWNYPRPNKGPIHRWLPSWRFVLASVLGAGILGIGLFLTAYVMLDVPDPEDVATAQSTTVYYADGETEMGQFATVRRTIIDTSELPDHVGNAIVASEDRRFYTNVGVDPIGIARAFINNVTGGKRQGGSTITQQYVERYYTGDNLGYRGKVKEAILALKIDRQQPKEQILGNYMNTIYFGRGANGIEQAAIEYFDKSAADLTISEAAMLAGIIPAPSAWDPAVSPERAEQRWSRTLGLMVEGGFITEAERAEQEFPDVRDPGRPETFAGTQGYLLREVRNELTRVVGFDDDEIDTGGYRIVTTIDPRLQEAAVDAAESLPEDRPANLQVGLISLDNATGAIRAMYGGHDYLERPLNNATQGIAQAGSTFKVFTLTAALDQGIELGRTFPSYSPMKITEEWTPKNFDGRDRGHINLVTATQHSVNTTYALLNQEVGPQNTVDMAVRLGLSPETKGMKAVPSNVLGSASPTVETNARAFSTIANRGVRTDPHIVDFVETASGAVTYSASTTGEQVIDPQVAADATYAMTKVIEGGTGNTAHALGRPAAGKTGSSTGNKSAWFVGYIPQLTTAVALTQTDEDGKGEASIDGFGGVREVAGGTWPTTIWTRFMLEAVKDLPVEDFPQHSPVAPPAPVPAPTPTEEETQEPEDEEESTPEPEPEPEPTPSPTPTTPPEPDPEPEPTPSPTPTTPPEPDPEPEPAPLPSGGG